MSDPNVTSPVSKKLDPVILIDFAITTLEENKYFHTRYCLGLKRESFKNVAKLFQETYLFPLLYLAIFPNQINALKTVHLRKDNRKIINFPKLPAFNQNRYTY